MSKFLPSSVYPAFLIDTPAPVCAAYGIIVSGLLSTLNQRILSIFNHKETVWAIESA